jgi:indole-3-glycerol phosphate synthase
MNILETIITHKRIETEKQKIMIPISQLEKRELFDRNCYSLKNRLDAEQGTGIIAEFKRRSPSKGMINENADIEKITKEYSTYGADALSVLTDSNFFGGSERDLMKARVNEIPILRKDFIIDEYQVIETKAIGADLILLIAACLTKEEVKKFAGLAKNIGLEVLLELHDEDELGHICDEIDLVGINNRDLRSFDVDLERSIRMSKQISNEKTLVAESGISSVDMIVNLKQFGFKGFLIGENFMKAKDPGRSFSEFVNSIPKK